MSETQITAKRPFKVYLRGVCPGRGKIITGWTMIDAASREDAERIAAARWADKQVVRRG